MRDSEDNAKPAPPKEVSILLTLTDHEVFNPLGRHKALPHDCPQASGSRWGRHQERHPSPAGSHTRPPRFHHRRKAPHAMLNLRMTDLKRWLVVLVVVILGCAYVKSQDSLLDLADRIEDQSNALRFSRESHGVVTRRLSIRAPWHLFFVPKSGIDEDDARKSGLRDEDLADVRNRLRSWPGSAVIVFVIPGGRSITRLAEPIDVERQISLKGSTGEPTLRVSLVRKGDTVFVSSVRLD